MRRLFMNDYKDYLKEEKEIINEKQARRNRMSSNYDL